jgi:hypothetical protein
MRDNLTDNQSQQSVIAMAKTDERFRTVEIRRQNGIFKILWARCSEDSDTNWQLFADDCGLPIERTESTDSDDDRIVVVGFDSTGMAFYRISVPAVEDKEIAAIVKLQAETRLPLPAEQMELTWRANHTQNGQVNVTMAAARREQLRSFVEDVRGFEPNKILLNCEGIVRAWKTLFAGEEKNAVVVSVGAQNTHVCLVENGRLSNVVVIDIGIENLSAGGPDEQAETTEMFTQDMWSVLELFSYKQSEETPVFVLSNGSAAYVSLVSSLRLAGLNARVASPEIKKLEIQDDAGVENIEDIFEYRVPIGLGLMALDTSAGELNIFRTLYKPVSEQKEKYWLYSPRVVYAITAVMLVLFVMVSYVIDAASPGAIENRLRASGAEADINMLAERQKVIKAVAMQRSDMLDLLSEINLSGQSGIKLESFHFKKGQRVTITGQATGNEQLYEFEKSLADRKDIKEVKMTSTPNTRTTGNSNGNRGPEIAGGPEIPRGGRSGRGGRGGGLKFTITFHYKNFTR